MKKILLIILLMNFCDALFADTIEKSIRVYGRFPAEKYAFFQTIRHDTLLFDHVDTILNTGWEWGIFTPQSNVLYIQNSYYKVIVTSASDFNLVSVYQGYHEGTRQIIPSYVSTSRWIYYVVSFFLLFFHYLIFYRLRRVMLRINRRGRHVSLQYKIVQTVLIVMCVIFFTALAGYYLRSYFFLCCPLVYLVFLLIPSGRWYLHFARKSDERFLGI